MSASFTHRSPELSSLSTRKAVGGVSLWALTVPHWNREPQKPKLAIRQLLLHLLIQALGIVLHAVDEEPAECLQDDWPCKVCFVYPG